LVRVTPHQLRNFLSQPMPELLGPQWLVYRDYIEDELYDFVEYRL
jgi:hypothetical protein